MDYVKLDEALYAAFALGISRLGADIKKVSWFARNKKVI